MISAAVAPALVSLIAEGDPATVQSAVTGMATTVATDGQSMLVSVIPVLAPLVAAVIVAKLGYRFVQRFNG